jgi:uncharacterized membrane protein YsdA (DUF1294 family)
MTLDTFLTCAAIFALWNVVVFCIYAYDKQAARDGAWRVREDTLILIAITFGGICAFVCQRWMRHKTRKGIFPTLLPAMAGLQGLLLLTAALFPGAVLEALQSFVELIRSA